LKVYLLLHALSLQGLPVEDQSEVEEGETLEKILFIILDVGIKVHLLKNVILAG